MVKDLYDGSKAVGLFNHSKTSKEVSVGWQELQISGKQAVRDLWRQKEIGTDEQSFKAEVPAQGVVMIKIRKL
jgi:alpha-galactosidase